jgi:hypothetical protein
MSVVGVRHSLLTSEQGGGGGSSIAADADVREATGALRILAMLVAPSGTCDTMQARERAHTIHTHRL